MFLNISIPDHSFDERTSIDRSQCCNRVTKRSVFVQAIAFDHRNSRLNKILDIMRRCLWTRVRAARAENDGFRKLRMVL